MQVQYPNGDTPTLTPAQEDRLRKIAAQHNLTEPITLYPDLGRSTTVLVRASGMTIGIEPDGYAHT